MIAMGFAFTAKGFGCHMRTTLKTTLGVCQQSITIGAERSFRLPVILAAIKQDHLSHR
jgi:hypothetical protein